MELNQKNLEKLQGWCTYEKAQRLVKICEDYTEALKSNTQATQTTIVEIGVFGGRSLVALSQAISNSVKTNTVIHGIDSYCIADSIAGTNGVKNDEWWSNNVNYDNIYFSALNALANFKAPAVILKLSSLRAYKLYDDLSINILHQDGNHSSEITCQEVELWAPKMKPGSLWILSAADWPSTEQSKLLLKAKNFILAQDYGEFQVYKKDIFKATTANTKIEESFLIKENCF